MYSTSLQNPLTTAFTALVEAADVKNLYMVIISLMQLTNGQDKESVINQWPGDARDGVRKALEDIKIG